MIDIDNELFIIIPGFGGNNINHKIEILQSNLNIIQSTWICDKISIIIYVYDPDIIQLIPKELFNNTNIKWIIQKGVVGNYLLQFQNEMKYSENSYLLILLDDVQLSNNVKLSKMVEYLNEFSFVKFRNPIKIKTRRLDSFDFVKECDTLIMDVQGAELKVLNGLDDYDNFKLIILEYVSENLYKNGCVFDDLYEKLTSKGFKYYESFDIYFNDASSVFAGNAVFVRK